MNDIHVLMAMVAGLGGIMLILWKQINSRLDKLDEKLTDVDRRICRLEGAFSAKECCGLYHQEHKREVCDGKK